MRTVRVHGDGLQLGDYDEVKVSESDCTDPHLVAECERDGKGVTLAERKLHRADIRHPPLSAVRQSHLALFDFRELQLGCERWWQAQDVDSRVDESASLNMSCLYAEMRAATVVLRTPFHHDTHTALTRCSPRIQACENPSET
jgi:hypothetical protein